MSEWIKCSDKLPKHGNVLCMFTDGECAVGWPVYWHGAREGEFAQFMFPLDDLDDGRKVTHWMPLPPPPAQEQPK